MAKKLPKRTAAWHRKITRKELAHLYKMDCRSLAAAKRNFAHQKRFREKHPDAFEPCWECRTIAHKLGEPV